MSDNSVLSASLFTIHLSYILTYVDDVESLVGNEFGNEEMLGHGAGSLNNIYFAHFLPTALKDIN